MVDDSQHSSSPDSIRGRVQSACTSGYTGIVRVTIVGDVGYWYFRRGAIFCAATLDLTGDEAALHMLSWQGCQWEPCSRPWPSEQSVFLSWVELFQRAGEVPRVTVPPAALPAVEPPWLSASERPAPRLSPASSRPPKPIQAEPPTLSAAQLEAIAGAASDFSVIEPDGRSRAGRGEAGQLTELASFGSQLCDRIGALIGAGRCQAFEVAHWNYSLLVASNGPSTLALTVARGGELERVKALLRI
jgi:hypothetical protein